jgi:hypothetical protein
MLKIGHITTRILDMLKEDVRNPTSFHPHDYNGFIIYFGGANHHYSKQEVTCRFKSDKFTNFEEDGRTYLQHPFTNSPVEIKFELSVTSNNEKYALCIKSDYFDYKTRGVAAYKKLCHMILSRLKGKKRGYFVVDGKDVPIPKMKLVKQIPKKTLAKQRDRRTRYWSR